MKHSLKAAVAAVAAMTVSLPSLAHVGSSAAPHLHAGDGWGVLAVAALTAVAAWLGRRGR
jgi:hypothetical protein